MKRIAWGGVLCLLLATTAPVGAERSVRNFGAPMRAGRNKNLPGPRPPSSPSTATATQHQRDVDGAVLTVYAYSSRISTPLPASFAGVLAVLRDPKGKSPAQSPV
jgi:hypothetical protein